MGMCDGNRRISLVCTMLLIPLFMSHKSARGTTLEKLLIMPGPVIEGHAHIEDDCKSCHARLSETRQNDLCVACHKEIGDDITRKKGYHGRFPPAQQEECSSCHTDHEGRDKDIMQLDEATFDHLMTDFPLRGAHKTVQCSDCHKKSQLFREAATTCIGCHRADDHHKGQLGESCNECHRENDWREAGFDHEATGFPLTGAHEEVMCSSCHRSEIFSEVGRTCVACHRSDDVHKGRNGTRCADCHRTSSWEKIAFNHMRVSGFPLDGGHRGLTCQDCHRADDFKDLGGSNCHSCHQDDDTHEGRNGTDCGSCHATNSWATVDFDHAAETGFALPAGHVNLECTACHTISLAEQIPNDCGGCHVNDDVHRQQLGTVCENCHSPTSWTAQIRFDHDLTNFPLIGAHADAKCTACHATAAYHDAEETCVACHEEDDAHRGALGPECDSCHNPNNWQSWVFDHAAQTEFALTGAHSGLACGACHSKRNAKDIDALPQDCNACHERDDPHRGRFGNDCGNCHTTSDFSDLKGM